MQHSPNPAYLAIAEAIALHRYKQQNDILTLLSLPPIPWHSLVPRPVIPLAEAQIHVERVTRACGVREDGSVAPLGDDEAEVTVDLEEEAKRVSQQLREEQRETGMATVLVDLDGYPYKLVLSDMDDQTNEQRLAVARLTRHTRIIDALQQSLQSVNMYITVPPSTPLPQPAPTSTTEAHPAAVPVGVSMPSRLRLAARLVPRFIAAAIKVEIALWMITRGLRTSDWRYWAFVAGAVGWWVWECVDLFLKEDRRLLNAAEREILAAAAEGIQGADADRLLRPLRARERGRRNRQQAPALSTPAPRPKPNPFPLLGLAYERRCLRLFYHDPSSLTNSANTPITTLNDHRIPRTDRNLPLAPPDPSAAWTYVFLPLYVCLLALWPAGDNTRKAAIRERETHMRLLSRKLTEAAESEAHERKRQKEGEEDVEQPDGNTDPSSPPPTDTTTAAVIPSNLSPRAERYWRRVLERGEVIDWDEERVAQAALVGGAGAEGEQEGVMGVL